MSERRGRPPDLLAARRWLDARRRGDAAPLPRGVARKRERDAAAIGRALIEQRHQGVAGEWLDAAAGTTDPAIAAEVGGWLVDAGRLEQAEAVLRRAAEGGDAEGALHLGRILLFKGDDGADEWLERALELQPSLWNPLAQDLTLRARPDLAARWRELAADLGDPRAVALSAVEAGNRGDLPTMRDRLAELDEPEDAIAVAAHAEPDDAVEAALTAAASTGHLRAQLELGRWLVRHERPAEAEPWLRKPADADLPEARMLLAAARLAQGDVEGGEVILRAAADGGDGRAAHELGVRAVDRGDRDGAAEWFCRSARLGENEGAYSMALLHREDMYAWMRWVGIAAARGHARAARDLGEFEQRQNHPVEARAWLRRAEELSGEIA